MKTIVKYYQRYWLYISLAFIFLICEALCELELPGYMSDIITYGIATNDLQAIKTYGWQMALLALSSAVFAVGVGYFGSKVAAYISQDIRHDVYVKVMSFSSEEYNKFSVSSLVTRCTNDITQIQTFTVMFLRLALFVPVVGIGGTIKALKYSSGIQEIKELIVLALLFVVAVAVVLVLVVLPKYIKMQKQVDRLNQVSNDELNGLLVIRAFNNQEYEAARFQKANEDLTKTNTFVNRITALMVPAMTAVMYAISIVVIVVVANVAVNIEQIANSMAFIQYTMQIIMALIMVSMLFILLPRSIVGTKRICEVLDMSVSIVDKKGLEIPTHDKMCGELEFKNVSYIYDKSKVLDDISFITKPGQVTAIIGSTGSGKSTLVNLIPRLMDVSSGSITIDGKDLKDYNIEDLRSNISFVPQKSILFSGTIESNIKFSNKDMSDGQMQSASNIAQANAFIESKEEKWNTPIAQNGANVSGGQKQRLAIARAVAKSTPIYVFDDSFSALDFKTDSLLRSAIKDNLKNANVIIVAQRVGSIKNADQIIVLDEGRIIASGKHEQLLKTCELYQEIASSQLSKEDLL